MRASLAPQLKMESLRSTFSSSLRAKTVVLNGYLYGMTFSLLNVLLFNSLVPYASLHVFVISYRYTFD